jgi:hypothetical protein
MRSPVLTAVIMKNALFCDLMPYNMVEIYQLLEEFTASIFRV